MEYGLTAINQKLAVGLGKCAGGQGQLSGLIWAVCWGVGAIMFRSRCPGQLRRIQNFALRTFGQTHPRSGVGG